MAWLATCEFCSDEIDAEEISIEAFEYAKGRLMCTGCFEDAVERDAKDNSQFGMGA
jgi:hypothetical protein